MFYCSVLKIFSLSQKKKPICGGQIGFLLEFPTGLLDFERITRFYAITADKRNNQTKSENQATNI